MPLARRALASNDGSCDKDGKACGIQRPVTGVTMGSACAFNRSIIFQEVKAVLVHHLSWLLAAGGGSMQQPAGHVARIAVIKLGSHEERQLPEFPVC